jgi:pseudaminic acid biosynthesis-associated methylase
MSDTKEFWQGVFGDSYHRRNRIDWRARIPFWTRIIADTGARSVHEFGSGAGYNLSAIRRAYPDVQVSGNDVNEQALYQCNAAGISAWNVMPSTLRRELVFTCGVLIHIAPEDLKATMQAIINASCDYVLAVEYFSVHEEELVYRDHLGKLWKRDFGKLYCELGLKLVNEGWVGNEDGFDNCAWWLLRKP